MSWAHMRLLSTALVLWIAYANSVLPRDYEPMDVEADDDRTTLSNVSATRERRNAPRQGPRQIPNTGLKKASEQDIILLLLKDSGYDWRVRPRGVNQSWEDTGGPVIVRVNMMIRSISKIDDVNMEYSAQFTFREQWTDPRLAYKDRLNELAAKAKHKYSTEELPKFVVLATSDTGSDQQIWMPDTFFQNEKEARRHLIDKPNVLIRIYPDGAILYSVRLSLVLSCPMSLEFYPLDHQNCLIDLASYAYTTEDIKYEWKSGKPIQLKKGLEQSLPSFALQSVTTDYCTSKTNTGEYSCLRTKLVLRREFSYYLLQLYIPSFMLVIVSWVSFWLDKDSVPARVTLGVTTLLTMTTQSSGINAKLPPVSYTKAIDVWIGVCLAFIFGALLEFALVNYAARKDMLLESRGRVSMHRGGNTNGGGGMPTTTITANGARLYAPASGNNNEMLRTRRMPSDPMNEQLLPTSIMTPAAAKIDASGAYVAVNSFAMSNASQAAQSTTTPSWSISQPQQQPQHQMQPQQQSPYNHPALMPPAVTTRSSGVPAGSSGLHHRATTLQQQQQSLQQQQPQHQQGPAIPPHQLPPNYPPSSTRQTPPPAGGLWVRFIRLLCFKKYNERAKRIDVIARVTFPAGFFIFNLIYWIMYLVTGEETG